MNKQYTVTRLDEWTDAQWAEVIEAIEDTVVAVADTFEQED